MMQNRLQSYEKQMKGTNISNFFFNYFILSYNLLFFEGDVFICVFFDLVEEYGLFLTIKNRQG